MNHYAVIFTSQLSDDTVGYEEMSKKMIALAKKQDGFLGIESARDANSNLGITVSYWKNLKSISKWRENIDHLEAQKLGREKWYKSFHIRICEVKKEYEFRSTNIRTAGS